MPLSAELGSTGRMESETTPKATEQPDLRVAICGSATVGEASAKHELARCIDALVPSLGMDIAPVEELPASPEAVDRVLDPEREAPLDLLVVDEDLPGLPGISLVRELRDAGFASSIVLMASSDELAYEALMSGVEAFVPKPATSEAFNAVVANVLTDIAARRRESVALHCQGRVQYVDKRDIVFAETIEHDQVVHVRNGDKLSIRSSSQALFDMLSPDSRFFKDGSSFIVNLSFVRSLGRDGSARLADGSTISVPVRLRRTFADALLAHSAGAPGLSS